VNGLKREFGDTVTVRIINTDDPDNQDLVEQYGAQAIPTTVILDKDGQMSSRWVGLTSRNRLHRAIERVLITSGAPV
jgi:thioredoxin-like negative regulator of GroEL